MRFTFASGPLSRSAADLVLLPLFESDLSDTKERTPALTDVEQSLGNVLLKAAAEEGFKAKADQTFVFHTHGKLKAGRVVLLGLGVRARFDPELLRMAAGRGVKVAQKLRVKEVALALPLVRDFEECVKAATEGLVLGAYRFDRYRSSAKEEKAPANLENVRFLLPEGQEKSAALEAAVELGRRVGEATNLARTLVNEPAGSMTPKLLADEARRVAKATGLKITIGGRKEIQALRMGMFDGVARGSNEEPQLVKMSYVPTNAKHAGRKPLVFVGKAITFDSGGLSLKTADGMMDMKTDMAGSAAVIGAMAVISHLAPPFPVHGIFGACENMPSGHAYRPGDVLTSRIGKTVEVLNTDAEGRLVLGDVLAWAAELEPAALVDLATLTGACMIALGHFVAGAWADDDALAFSVLEASRRAGEQIWRMPLVETQRDSLRSEIADLKNIGERWGGAINAALFLREFVGNTPWVHLDIAGPSQSPKERGYYSKGGSGIGVRTLVELVRRKAAESGQEEGAAEGKSSPSRSKRAGAGRSGGKGRGRSRPEA